MNVLDRMIEAGRDAWILAQQKKAAEKRVKAAQRVVEQTWDIVGGATGQSLALTEIPLLLEREYAWSNSAYQLPGLEKGRGKALYLKHLGEARDVHTAEGRQAAILWFERLEIESQRVAEALEQIRQPDSSALCRARRKVLVCQTAKQLLAY